MPKEHGAYGQLAFPIVTAWLAAGGSRAAGMLAVATVASFLAHEPAVVLLGLRGARAKREMAAKARLWLAGWLSIAAVAGVGAFVSMASSVRWSMLVPLLPAAVLALAVVRGREKTFYGEIASALAFSGVAVPMTLSVGGSVSDAVAIAVPFALLFVAGTLAVRVVILRVRGGGNARAAAGTRRAAFALAGAATAVLSWAVAAAALPVSVAVATAPGLAMAVAVAARPPAPSRLKTLGWLMVATSVATAAITITGVRL